METCTDATPGARGRAMGRFCRMDTDETADVVVIGAGIAGLVAALELIEHGRDVLLLDRCEPHEVGGLAREAFGGMFMVDSPEQRRGGGAGSGPPAPPGRGARRGLGAGGDRARAGGGGWWGG